MQCFLWAIPFCLYCACAQAYKHLQQVYQYTNKEMEDEDCKLTNVHANDARLNILDKMALQMFNKEGQL